ncbi:MAG TPA: LnmK family bifunctional acyltransferase/decarboxylase [Vicinamibacterales bacterium]|nr:LnmK family bifunctional acyltransferase/decarboxylase [Vicinamibacterales bacterium]
MTYFYDLTLGLPHTNHRGLSEPLLLMSAGHFQWTSIAAATGGPLSRLRTAAGGEVYAAFYYIEERFPASTPLDGFGLDDKVRFAIKLRSFKNIAVEGRIVFDRPERLADPARVEACLAPDAVDVPHPFIRFGNIFVTPVKGNSVLRVAPPASADFSGITPLPNADNPYHLTRAASEGRGLGVLDDRWAPIGSFEHRYRIDVDRDTNGAGLVYFANYAGFMDTAERLALAELAPALPLGPDRLGRRSLSHRRIGYYGNADVSDTIAVRVTVLRDPESPQRLGFRYAIERDEDGQTICLSEAVKVIPLEQ